MQTMYNEVFFLFDIDIMCILAQYIHNTHNNNCGSLRFYYYNLVRTFVSLFLVKTNKTKNYRCTCNVILKYFKIYCVIKEYAIKFLQNMLRYPKFNQQIMNAKANSCITSKYTIDQINYSFSFQAT